MKSARPNKGGFKDPFEARKETTQVLFLMPTLIEPVDKNIFKNQVLLLISTTT